MTTGATTTPATITADAFSCAEIPIWVCGKPLWISGVDRKTTVHQVVETLLGRPDRQYSIVEKWRQVERPLSGDTRILKLWKTWGDSKTEVKLSLKKIQTENDIDTSAQSISTTKKKTRYYKSACSKYGQTIHPKRLVQLSKTHTIERLLKLILVQGETIQNQIYKLKDRQFEIEQLECEQHKNRIDTLGTNYLVNTYLGMNEDKDSGVTTECVVSSENNGTPTETVKQRATSDEYYDDNDNDDGGDYDYDENNGAQRTEDITIEEDIETEIEELRNKIFFLDKIVKINKKLEKEEENLVRLFINIERCKKDDISSASVSDELDLRCDLSRLQIEIEKRENEFDNNCKILRRVENNLETRKYYLKRLHDDFYDETNQCEYDQQPFAICGVRSIFRNALPYYTCAAAAATTANKPVLNTLV